ncbi:hypothetical protein RUE5091_01131 [Ruegeria denitrificans]|uniref:Uncharacterized protein n=1 Tax=Ruegeria denitrificans TaxID=1715692 RepID=A0A0N7M8W3_9RHOB|nr:hypothetical protein RUE5091_01131 [Ruegeria denitrificans]
MTSGLFASGLKISEPHAGEAYGSDTGRGQWTDIGDDSLTSYGNNYEISLNVIHGL